MQQQKISNSIPAVLGVRKDYQWRRASMKDLPEDMQDLLFQYAEADMPEIPWEFVEQVSIEVDDVHIAPLVMQVKAEMAAGGKSWWDYRGPKHVKELAASFRSECVNIPPIIVSRGKWKDGRHRLLAAESIGKTILPAIDYNKWLSTVRQAFNQDLSERHESKDVSRPRC